jgi:hypothetical protein
LSKIDALKKNQSTYDVVVIGAGAAGFFCAGNIAENRPDLSVVILEKSNKVLSKVLVSGGGRCNVTHACFEPKELVKFYPRGERELLGPFTRFGPSDTISWFEERGVTLKVEDDGRMFPDTDNSQTIANCLQHAAYNNGVKLHLNTEVVALERKDDYFQLTLRNDEKIQARFVVVAAGGYPKATQFAWLTAIGHHIIEPVPSLFTFNIPGHRILELMGVSVPHATVTLHEHDIITQGPLLVTHWGLSGPAALKASSAGARRLAQCRYHFKAQVNWVNMTTNTVREKLLKAKRNNESWQTGPWQDIGLPKRLREFMLQESGVDRYQRWADVPDKMLESLATCITEYELEAKGKTTFKEEFVTCGGIDLKEVNMKTMESRLHPHLYFCGEILDIDAVTGGFNFQAAWTTAWHTAQAIISN